MRKIREILRLKYDRGLSNREIAQACSMGRSTVGEYLERARNAGIGWPVDLDDGKLERLLFVKEEACQVGKRSLPEWTKIHRELKRKGVTLSLLWQEYKAAHPDAYQYSQFCELYRNWLGTVVSVMRQKHKAGEKLFVDYAGQTIPVVDSASDQIREAQLFLAVLGASSYIYAEATWTQSLPDWIGSHVRALEYLGGVPEVIVPDNLKSGRHCLFQWGPTFAAGGPYALFVSLPYFSFFLFRDRIFCTDHQKMADGSNSENSDRAWLQDPRFV